jgi:putative (di)nucleoside polyphosphate hydrolase
MMLLNAAKKVFVAKRIDTRLAGWQMPQGGIDEEESHVQAAFRELKEEIGTNNVEIIAATKSWLHYDLPAELIKNFWQGKYRGQQQIWFAMHFLGDDAEINLLHSDHAEFSQWQWLDINELADITIPFKRQLYRDVIAELRPKIDEFYQDK